MNGMRGNARRGTHPLVVAGLVLCAGWLIVQNAVLIALVAWAGPQSAVAAVRAVLRVGLALFAQGWWLPLAVLSVLALIASGLRSETRREVRHG